MIIALDRAAGEAAKSMPALEAAPRTVSPAVGVRMADPCESEIRSLVSKTNEYCRSFSRWTNAK
jgi:hypothetical protein